MTTISDNPIEFSGILQRGVDHLNAGNVRHLTLLSQEVQSITSDFPLSLSSLLFTQRLVLLDELH